MHAQRFRSPLPAVVTLALLASCTAVPYNAEKAQRPYPVALHSASAPVDIEVFRTDNELTIVNSTTASYRAFDLWLNQRYVQHVERLDAGETIAVSLSEFWDRWGNSPNRGGFLRRYAPTPIRLVEIEVDDASPLIGLVAFRDEPAT